MRNLLRTRHQRLNGAQRLAFHTLRLFSWRSRMNIGFGGEIANQPIIFLWVRMSAVSEQVRI